MFLFSALIHHHQHWRTKISRDRSPVTTTLKLLMKGIGQYVYCTFKKHWTFCLIVMLTYLSVQPCLCVFLLPLSCMCVLCCSSSHGFQSSSSRGDSSSGDQAIDHSFSATQGERSAWKSGPTFTHLRKGGAEILSVCSCSPSASNNQELMPWS